MILNNITILQELLDIYGINYDKFYDKISQLYQLEVLEIQSEQVVTMSDQCLSNYLLYYIFIQEKVVSLSKVIEIGFKHFPKGIIRSINTIFNIFNSKEIQEFCQQEILKAWDRLKVKNDKVYENFVRAFHIFRPECAFLMAQKKITDISDEDFNIYDVDFSKESSTKNEKLLEFLGEYYDSESLNYVISLLLAYASKTSANLVSACKWLESSYGIDIDAYRYEYSRQQIISDYLLKAIKSENLIAMAVAFRWVKYSLALSFHYSQQGRGYNVKFIEFDLKNTAGLISFRAVCWQILAFLSKRGEWKESIILFLEEYAKNLKSKVDIDIVKSEISSLEKILTALKSNNISFIKLLNKFIITFNSLNIKLLGNWSDIFNNKEWEVYQLLRTETDNDSDYNVFVERRRLGLLTFGEKLKLTEISAFVQRVNKLLTEKSLKREAYSINQGVEVIISGFNKVYLEEFMNSFIRYGQNLSISASVILNRLILNSTPCILLEKIKMTSFPQQNEWLFRFFEVLPAAKIDSGMLKEFLAFFESNSDKDIHASPYRSLKLLDNFMHLEPNIYPLVSTIIYNKRHYNGFLLDIYFFMLFNEKLYTPKLLLDLYQNDISLLQDIYFYLISSDWTVDFSGIYILEFLQADKSWLKKYSESFWHQSNNKSHYNYYNNALWKDKDFMTYFDYIFYHFPEDSFERWHLYYRFRDLLKYSDTDDYVNEHKKEWIIHIVKQNVLSQKIVDIFKFVCELNNDIKRCAIQTFLEYNSDFESFNKLQLVPNSWSSENGSFIPAYQNAIEFLESLLPNVCTPNRHD